MCPVLCIGLQRVLGRSGSGIVAGRIDQPIERAGASDMGGQGDAIAFLVISLVDASIIKLTRGC